MKGRKPKPEPLAKLHGRTTHARKKPAHAPDPVGNLDDPPDWLNEDQKQGWRYAMEHAPAGLLRHIDRGILVVWVVAEGYHRDAVMRQHKLGLLVKTPNTAAAIQSPYLPIINRQGAMMMKAAAELGFSPAARPRISADLPSNDKYPRRNTGSLEAFLAEDEGGAATRPN